MTGDRRQMTGSCERRERPHGRRAGDGGYVTIMVLTVAALLAALVSATMHVARPSVGQALVSVDELQANGLLEAGLASAGYVLFAAKKPADKIEGMVFPFETGAARLSVRSEATRIDLNGAEAKLLEGLYKAFGTGAMSPRTFASRVIDWRDSNAKPRPDGAEKDEYFALGLQHAPRNAPFQSVGELRHVAGMTDQDIEAMRPFITVFNPDGSISPKNVDRRVLMAVPQMTSAQADTIVEAFANPDASQAELKSAIRPFNKFLTLKGSDVYRVNVEARLNTGYAKVAEAVIMEGNNRSPYRVLYWRAIPAPPVTTTPGTPLGTAPVGAG